MASTSNSGDTVRQDYRFCPRCGSSLEKRFTEGRDRLVCTRCGFVFYQNPLPAAAVILERDHKVLLVKRKFEPRAGAWTLPAGFIEQGEGPEACAIREATEETNLDIRLGGLFGVYSGMDDPRQHVLLVVYRGIIEGGEMRPGDDAEEAGFFTYQALPKDIAFESHRQILHALRRENEK